MPEPTASGPAGLSDLRSDPGLRRSRPSPSAAPGRPASPPVETVAAFDFDGTLVSGGSVLPFLAAVRGPAPVAREVLRALPKLVRGAVLGGSWADTAKEQLFVRLLGGLRAEEVAERAAAFGQRHLGRRLRPAMRDRLEWHRAQGHRLLVVSASPEYYVGPCAELLAMDGAVGTRLAVDSGGLLTGYYEGRNCRGAEKYTRVVAWLRDNGLGGSSGQGQPVLWAYGNSRGDRRMLDAADYGVDAGRLGRVGSLRRFLRLRDVAGR